jgi:hypothetical protein
MVGVRRLARRPNSRAHRASKERIDWPEVIGTFRYGNPPLTAGRSSASATALFEIVIRAVAEERRGAKPRRLTAVELPPELRAVGHSGANTAKFPVSAKVKSLILDERVATTVLTLGKHLPLAEEILALQGGREDVNAGSVATGVIGKPSYGGGRRSGTFTRTCLS